MRRSLFGPRAGGLVRGLAFVALAVAAWLVASPIFAQTHAAPTASSPTAVKAAEDAAPDSPRASMRRFLDLCGAGEYGEAARYLDVADPTKVDAPLLARHLRVVLDREGLASVDALSPKSLGDQGDKLPPGVEEIGAVRGEPIRLVRRQLPDGARWIFSRATVEHVDSWYGRLKNAWFLDLLPERLLTLGWHELAWWQWIALPCFFVMAWVVGKVLSTLLGRAIDLKKGRFGPIFRRAGGAFHLVFALFAVEAYLPYLELNLEAAGFVDRALRAAFLLAFFWFVLGAIDLGGDRVMELDRGRENAATRSLVPLAVKASKIAVIVMALIAALSELGYPVTSLIAGLGISGIAFALAAQKTVENLFGSVSIGVDQPFRIGDFVKIDDVKGTVESIGLRSTRIRTLDRTVVTIPNGKLADQRVESFAERDRIHLATTLTLALGASSKEVRSIVEAIEARVREEETLHASSLVVKLTKITDAGFELTIDAWFETTDSQFASIRQELLLAFLDAIERAGARLAIPARGLSFVEPRAKKPESDGEKTTKPA